MKIGDRVRFMSEVGGGIVAGFQDKYTVLVEDEDGFQIPTPINDVVVIETDDYNIAKVHTSDVSGNTSKTKALGVPKAKSATQQFKDEDEDYDPSERPITFKAKAEERKGGDKLSAYLAFVPVDIKEVSSTTFEAYFINDSNYYMYYTYLSAEGNEWTVRSTGEVEPNTKLFVEEFGRDTLGEMERVALQVIAYKKDKGFLMKPTIDVQIRIDSVKFYKLHTFQENDFFEAPALLYTIIENDKVARPLVIDAEKLKQEMYQKNHEVNTSSPARIVKHTDDKNAPIVIDLHASELLESTAGMSAADILKYQIEQFDKTIEKYKQKRGTKIVFIHGKGEGVLRHAIVNELNYRYKQYQYQDASFQEYGYGATQVTIK